MEILFETDRLIMRKFTPADAEQLYCNHLEAEVKKWIPNECYTDLTEAESAISFYIDRVNANRLPYVFAVVLKQTQELIGDAGINRVEGAANEVEVGYTICKQHSGKGYATELLAALTDFAVSTFDIHVLYGRVMRGNVASVRILEKNGFRFLKEEFGAEDDPYGNGIQVYSLER